MNILIVGAGAREQAIAFKLQRSCHSSVLFSWPDSIAMRSVAETIGIESGSSVHSVAFRAKQLSIDLVIVGPEGPLADGIADECERLGMPTFGPKKSAAQLESSKSFSKAVMKAANIPTADCNVHRSRDSCVADAERLLQRDGWVVLKASGLAAGKGVFVCQSHEQINEAIRRLYETSMQSAAAEVLVEEYMSGREVSYFCTLGKAGVNPIGFAVDHKRLLDGDRGPNTGGMGCYTPVEWLPLDAETAVLNLVVQPLVRYFQEQKLEYCGWLYTGLMWSKNGPRVVEFNARLGDPEAEVLAMADHSDWLDDILVQVGLRSSRVTSSNRNFDPTLCVIMASSDYPYGESSLESAQLPTTLLGLQDSGVAVWGAAVKDGISPQNFSTNRGRVLAVVGGGKTIDSARESVYSEVDRIHRLWPTSQFRRDIAATANKTLDEQ